MFHFLHLDDFASMNQLLSLFRWDWHTPFGATRWVYQREWSTILATRITHQDASLIKPFNQACVSHSSFEAPAVPSGCSGVF